MNAKIAPRVEPAAEDAEPRCGILLAYKPVHAHDRSVAAYQIVLDSNGCDDARVIQDLSSNLVLDTYADIYQHGHLETVPHFLSVDTGWLQDSRILSLPRKHYILEFATGAGVPAGMAEHMQALKQRGYRLSLSGHQPDNPQWLAMLDIVNIVRLDLASLGIDGLAAAARDLYFHNVKLLVENVNDVGQFQACADLGITWFQGGFLNKVASSTGKKLPANTLVPMELLAALNDPATTSDALEGILVKDARLSFRILKIINSAAVGLQRHVDSVADAITLLGTNELERWANLLLMQGAPNQPEELTRSALIRAHMCEDLAKMSGQDGSATRFFTTGLLSQLDVLMNVPMPDLMKQVPLSTDVKAAVLHREGAPGKILTEAENYLDGHFDRLQWLVDPFLYTVAYQRSVAWGREMQQVLGSD